MDQYQLHMVRLYTNELKREEKVTIRNITKYDTFRRELKIHFDSSRPGFSRMI